jgi:2-dehydro-3-deoxyglucarate aldolase/4-hydroxy-2-oxoheptanedioate aldolase
MSQKSLKARVRAGEVLIGPIVTLSSPDVAEALAQVGFDYLWIENEHAPLGVLEAQRMLQAVGGGCPTLIRVPTNDPVWLKKTLDTGCDGVVVPLVKSAAEARRAVDACRYPPAGNRGVGITRAHRYGLGFAEYVEAANEEIAVVLQVEHAEAVENVEAIAQVPGVDALLVGPYDLSGSMGLLGQVDHPDVQAAIERVQRACEDAGMTLGIFAGTPEQARRYIAAGFSLIALGLDVLYLWQAAQAALKQAREAA